MFVGRFFIASNGSSLSLEFNVILSVKESVSIVNTMKFFPDKNTEDQKPIPLAEIVKRKFIKRKENPVGYSGEYQVKFFTHQFLQYQIPNREAHLQSLLTKKFDVLVIGGGAVGKRIRFLSKFIIQVVVSQLMHNLEDLTSHLSKKTTLALAHLVEHPNVRI